MSVWHWVMKFSSCLDVIGVNYLFKRLLLYVVINWL